MSCLGSYNLRGWSSPWPWFFSLVIVGWYWVWKHWKIMRRWEYQKVLNNKHEKIWIGKLTFSKLCSFWSAVLILDKYIESSDSQDITEKNDGAFLSLSTIPLISSFLLISFTSSNLGQPEASFLTPRTVLFSKYHINELVQYFWSLISFHEHYVFKIYLQYCFSE